MLFDDGGNFLQTNVATFYLVKIEEVLLSPEPLGKCLATSWRKRGPTSVARFLLYNALNHYFDVPMAIPFSPLLFCL